MSTSPKNDLLRKLLEQQAQIANSNEPTRVVPAPRPRETVPRQAPRFRMNKALRPRRRS